MPCVVIRLGSLYGALPNSHPLCGGGNRLREVKLPAPENTWQSSDLNLTLDLLTRPVCAVLAACPVRALISLKHCTHQLPCHRWQGRCPVFTSGATKIVSEAVDGGCPARVLSPREPHAGEVQAVTRHKTLNTNGRSSHGADPS